MKKMILILLAFLAAFAPSRAQVNGLGRGKILGTTTHSVSMGPRYMDDLKAPVTSIAPTGTGYVLTVPTAAIASQFTPGPSCSGSSTVGDMVLIIQMKSSFPALTGSHQNGIVTSVAGNTITVCTISGGTVPFSLSSTQDRVQIIRIREYVNFTLASGELTCDPWNEATGTGGVLCFLVRGTLTINGGVINAAAKGYGPYNVTSWGTGGVGAPGATAWTPIGNPAPLNTLIGCELIAVAQGQDGGGANNVLAPGTVNMPAVPANFNPGAPFYYTDAVMGQAGYYPAGYGAGDGAGGGGKGGDGAASCLSAGLPGDNGWPGGNGGNAGRGARGGGIVIVKANMINRSAAVTYPCFSARGQSGDAGRAGGNGGQGGNGGSGGDENCNVCYPGGDGGKGETGTPANGGDGSNGGSPGMIWVAANTINGLNTANLDVAAGAGGMGGPGGYRWTTLPIPLRTSACPDTCPPSGGCTGGCTTFEIVRICDKYRAFCMLASATSAANHVPGNNGINVGYDYRAGTTLRAVYDIDNNELVGIEIDPMCCIEYHYVAPLYCMGNECQKIFRKLAFGVTGQTSVTGQIVDLARTTHNGTCNLLPAPPVVHFRDNFNNDMFIYHGALDYIEDLSEPGHPRCYMGPCTPVPADGQGMSGQDGLTPENGTKEFVTEQWPTDRNAEGIIHDVPPGGMWRTMAGTAPLAAGSELKLYPQPAANETRLLLTENFRERINLKIYDVNGRLLKDWNEQLDNNQQAVDIDLSALSTGLYTLKVTNIRNETSALKLIVE